MPSLILHFSLILISLSEILLAYAPSKMNPLISRIAFGSCNKQTEDQSYWKQIEDVQPDLWIWLGDNIYGDSLSEEVLSKKYEQQYNNVYYKSFRESFPIVGIWDDHDYGENDAHGDFEIKAISQKLCLNFLDEPKNSNRREQEGLYTSYTFKSNDQKLKLILLDTRYHSEEPNKNAHLLGLEQWRWLERQLSDACDLYMIASGIQFLPVDHRFEKWSNYETEYKRFLTLLESKNLSNVVLLSGDRHLHEINEIDRKNHENPILEITSSGLTHSYSRFRKENNRYRKGEVFAKRGFGVIEINWEKQPVKVTAKVLGFDLETKLKSEMFLR